MNEINLRMLFDSFTYAILHVIRIGDDDTCPFGYEVIHQLRQRQSWSVGGIHFIKIKHFHSLEFSLHVETGIVVSLAPSPVIIWTY